jgi:hypothetical protein
MLQVYPIFSAPCAFDSNWKVSFQGLLTMQQKNSKTCRIERRRGDSNSNMAKRSELKNSITTKSSDSSNDNDENTIAVPAAPA